MGERVLLTGGGGFIGSHLSNELSSRGYEVKVFDRRDGCDVTNMEKLLDESAGCDAIFNLAGVLGTHELNEGDAALEAVPVNIGGALNCLEVCRRRKIKFMEIGKPNVWLNTYSITKQAAEDFTLLYVKEHGVKAWVARWFNVFGPGQHYGSPQKLAPTSIVRSLKGKAVQIFGDGKQTVDHLYVKDVVRATVDIFACERVMGEPVEVGSGDDMPVLDFVSMILKATGSKKKVEFVPMRSGENPRSVIRADITLLHAKVGFLPRYTLEQGIEETVAYYREHLEEYD